jgi:hypothetical protein
MDAKLVLNERHILSENSFVEMVVWQLQSPLSGSHHGIKYRLALIVNQNCVLRYDNEAGKGASALIEDFWNDVEKSRF